MEEKEILSQMKELNFVLRSSTHLSSRAMGKFTAGHSHPIFGVLFPKNIVKR
jgi:hypothetical protein